MKKTAAIFIVILLSFLAVFPAAAASQELSAWTPEELSPGKGFDVFVRFSPDTSCGAVKLSLKYDSSLLRTGKTELQNKRTTDYFHYYDDGKTVSIILKNKTEGIDEFKVCQHFIPLDKNTVSCGFTITVDEIADRDGKLVDVSDIASYELKAQAAAGAAESSAEESSHSRSSAPKADSSRGASEKSRSEKTTKDAEKSSTEQESSGAAEETTEKAPERSVVEYSISLPQDKAENAGNRYIAAAGFILLLVIAAAGAFLAGRRGRSISGNNDGNPDSSCSGDEDPGKTDEQKKEKNG